MGLAFTLSIIYMIAGAYAGKKMSQRKPLEKMKKAHKQQARGD